MMNNDMNGTSLMINNDDREKLQRLLAYLEEAIKKAMESNLFELNDLPIQTQDVVFHNVQKALYKIDMTEFDRDDVLCLWKIYAENGLLNNLYYEESQSE